MKLITLSLVHAHVVANYCYYQKGTVAKTAVAAACATALILHGVLCTYFDI